MTENKINPYGYCPKCGQPGVSRERRPDGNDRCGNGHTYPSSESLHPEVEINFYKIDIPLSNYEGNGIFNQSIYIKSKQSPSKEQVLMTLKKLHDRDGQYQEYTGTWKEAIEVTDSILSIDFPRLNHNLIQTSEYVIHPKFGKQSLTIRKLTFFEV